MNALQARLERIERERRIEDFRTTAVEIMLTLIGFGLLALAYLPLL